MGLVQLKAKDILFEEGDQSHSAYLIKKGMIRIFKRKGNSHIEIGTISQGQLLGELAFLDRQNRSASAEAITDTEVVEISQVVYDDAIAKIPEWLVVLIKTITSRVRTATNKIKQLENASTEYETDKFGNRSKEYTYVNTSELLRFCTALLVVASRYGITAPNGEVSVDPRLLERFAAQVLQVSSSKVFGIIELFKKNNLLREDLILSDILFIDELIQYLNDQNLKDPAKKRKITSRGFSILSIIVQHHAQAENLTNDEFKLNVGPMLKEQEIQLNHLADLFAAGFIQESKVVSAQEIFVLYKGKTLMFDFRTFSLLNAIEQLNEEKRKA